MFETFGVPGLYIAVQAVLALAASWSAKSVSLCCPLEIRSQRQRHCLCSLDAWRRAYSAAGRKTGGVRGVSSSYDVCCQQEHRQQSITTTENIFL